MVVLINELSLAGQFDNIDEFSDSFDCVLAIIKILDKVKFSLSKEDNFFKSKITSDCTFRDILKLRSVRAKRMKRFLDKLMTNPPSWNDKQLHDCNDSIYEYKSKDICNTSLAESCKRDKIIISFKHKDFNDKKLEVNKDNHTIEIFNIIGKISLIEYLKCNKKIQVLEYCKLKYQNLDFSKTKNKEFDLLEPIQISDFINSFNLFSKMSWADIEKSKGLDYKKYNGTKIQSNNKQIYKFRTTKKYRCFGYRERDVFYILEFETDHKTSDKG